MAITQEVYKWRRIVMVRFKRAVRGDPVVDKPDMDVRGSPAAEHGAIVGLCQGDTITVRLSRELISHSAQLYATSSDASVVTVVSPPLGKLPGTKNMDIQLHGVAGGNPKTAKVQVRYGSNVGHVIHELTAWVFTPVDVDITPHVVTIAQTGSAGAGIASTVNIAAIIDKVRAIWRTCGVTFTVGATKNDSVSFATAGVVAWGTEVNQLLQSNHVPNTINAYFVNQIGIPGQGGVLGLGFSRASITTWHLVNPGIILADTDANGDARATDSMWLANDLAHEIGHFFALDHPEKGDASTPANPVRSDTWSERRLMHNYNLMAAVSGWRNDVGYGAARRGCLLTMKHLAQLTTDGECTIARATITSTAGPY